VPPFYVLFFGVVVGPLILQLVEHNFNATISWWSNFCTLVLEKFSVLKIMFNMAVKKKKIGRPTGFHYEEKG
jgi:hypothetical protein